MAKALWTSNPNSPAKTLANRDTDSRILPDEDEPLRDLVRRVAGDAARRAGTYLEDTLVPGGGE